MEFERRKAATMATIATSSKDKSPKGSIDTPIIPLLTLINNHPSYYTTSSCSGRISIFSHPPNKPKGGTWMYISHDKADPGSILSLLFHQTDKTHQTHMLVFRFEPLIIAIECKDVSAGQKIVSLGVKAGFRESGITSVSEKRVIVAIRCSLRLEVPLGCKGDGEGVLVSEDYVRFLVGIANEKMDANLKRTDGFFEALRIDGFGSVGGTEGGGGEDHCGEGSHEVVNVDAFHGPLSSPGSRLAISPIAIVGEPLEKLFLWGHSACTISHIDQKEILIFGGFGGTGRHARRSDCLLLDPSSGRLVTLDVKNTPSPRVGHTSSLVGDLMLVIGGRADPANILDDLWIFNTTNTEWKLVCSTSNAFTPRHRHAAAVVDSKLYLFGGLNNDTLYSSLLELDVDTLQWNEVQASGEWPCARHSHSLVAHGSKLYLFGGYDGEKALGDLYSYDVQEYSWLRVKAAGKPPYPRFSHSMFVYKDYLGIIGGCPVRQHCQELSLLDLRNLVWKHVILDSLGKELFVRSTANIVDDDLIMTGGGAACYAFGTKFSEPMKINLLPLATLGAGTVCSLVDEKQHIDGAGIGNNGVEIDSNSNMGGKATNGGNCAVKAISWVLQLQKKYAKLAKDILKKFGWLDLGRKVYSHQDGSHIYFPVTDKFCTVFSAELSQKEGAVGGPNDLNLSKLSIDSDSVALELLITCGASKHVDEHATMKKSHMSPSEAMKAALAPLLKQKGLCEDLLKQLPTRWERLGDVVVLPVTSFSDPVWDTIGSELWPAVAKSLGARRLARQGRVASTGTRDSRLELLVGDNGWVEHRENGILYCFDATKCMFSWGNLSEKLRMARLDCKGEVIVDLFTGIGYFTLPFLVRSHAKLVYACEWNPYAVEALRHNLEANSVSDRCIVLEGDNRITAPKGVADRVCLGLLPSSEGSWVTAVRALRSEGGTLHVHSNVKDSEEIIWTEHAVKSISEIAKSEGHDWNVSMVHLERVKWYAPHIRHVVADIRCQQNTK